MIKIYHIPRTRSVRVIWTLEELGQGYELALKEREDLKNPDYLKIHPLGRVPAIEDDGVTMFESSAIVEYLVEKYDTGTLAPEPGTPERAPYLQWMHFAEATMMPNVFNYLRWSGAFPGMEGDNARAAELKENMEMTLSALDQALSGRDYLLGSAFTAADIVTGYGAVILKGFNQLAPYPALNEYAGLVASRPAYQKAAQT